MTADDTDNRAALELLEDLSVFSPEVYVWRGSELVGHNWVETDPPVGGDSVSYDWSSMVNRSQVYDLDEDDVQYIEIPGTGWGDYCGSSWNRSNARSIRRDYGEHVITLTGGHDSESLAVRLDSQIPVDLYDAILGLGDYPIYDESDLSELESEMESEDWESWGRADFEREIRGHAEAEDEDDKVAELDDSDFVDELFHELGQNGDVLMYRTESAAGGVWEDFELAAKRGWDQIRDKRAADWDAYARHLSNPIPGQLPLLPL